MKLSTAGPLSGFAIGIVAVVTVLVCWRQTPPDPAQPSVTKAVHGPPLPIAPLHGLGPEPKLEALLDKPFSIKDRGTLQALELARDELFKPGSQSIETIPEQPDAKHVLAYAEQVRRQTGAAPQLVFYPPGARHKPELRRVLTNELLIHTSAPAEAIAAAKALGCADARAVAGVKDYVVASHPGPPGSSIVAAGALAQQPGIHSAEPMLGGSLRKLFVPNDPLFSKQWHLRNTGQVSGVSGIDVNVVPAWDGGKGSGVVIGILDDGLETTHPDLSPHYLASASYDFVDGDAVPNPVLFTDDHGTCVAGVAAAAGNNGLGISGAAPLASLAGLRLLSASTSEATVIQSIGFANDVISIKNNSWGSNVEAWQLGTISPAVVNALKDAATNGRGGKGVIITFAAGNGYLRQLQGNKDAYPNSIYVCAVGAVTASGTRSETSETGAHLLACAPSGGGSYDPKIVTTDRLGNQGFNSGLNYGQTADPDYSNSFDGTSAAAPVVAGVVALMLEANPALGWRDVKEILLRSGTKLQPTNSDWVSRSGGNTTLPLIKHNHQFGGGLVNAASAVNLARTWTCLDTMSTLSQSVTGTLNIPDYSSKGTTVAFDFSGDTATRVEQVEVVVDMRHDYRGDVSIDLVSPAGTVSHLATSTLADDGLEDGTKPHDYGYPDWTFSSARHWGESSVGTWKVIFRDLQRNNTGYVAGVTVRLHGVTAPPAFIATQPPDEVVRLGSSVSLDVVAGGAPNFTYQWSKGTTKVTSAVSPSYAIATASTAHAGSYSVLVTNLTGKVTSQPVNLGVVDTNNRNSTLNEGSTLTLQAIAAGPGIQYRWRKDGTDMADDAPGPAQRISGTGSSRLVVKNAGTGDAAVYTCLVTVGTASLATGAYDVHVRVRPQITDFNFAPTIVSDSLSIPVPITATADDIDGMPTRFKISGLPSGLTYSTTTGMITGRPNVDGFFIITIVASNAAGSSDKFVRSLSIDKLDTNTVGTFNGLVDRNALGNGSHGGKLNVVTQPTGTFTGKLTMAASSYAISGRLLATTAADPGGTFSIYRGTKVKPLTGTFSINRSNGHLIGTVDDTTPTFVANVEAWHNPYSSASRAGDIATTYNAWIDPLVDSSAPQGASHGTLVINTLGAATWSGKLADGTAISNSTTVSQNGDVPLHAMLYSNTGSFCGWLAAVGAAAPATNTLSGSMSWIKNPQSVASTTRSYKNGFILLNMNVTGGEYVKPVSPAVLWGLSNVNTILGVNNAKLTFSDAGVTAALNYLDIHNKGFRVLQTGSVQLPLPSPNAAALTLTINSSTGTFSGSATLKDSSPVISRPLSFSGVIATGQSKGRGFFTLSELPNNAASPILSGSVELIAGP